MSLLLSLLLCFSLFLTCPLTTYGSLLPTPTPEWSFVLLGNNRSLQRGNAVVSWRGDGNKIFITASDASLHIIDVSSTTEPTTIAVFEPDIMEGTTPRCDSAAQVVEASESSSSLEQMEEPYLLYAMSMIADDTTSGSSSSSSSQVNAVNFDGSLRWMVSVPGIVVGTPTVGKNGRFIYVSHTDNDSGQGFLSVIDTTVTVPVTEIGEEGSSTGRNTTRIPAVVASLAPEGRVVPLGPPAVQRFLNEEQQQQQSSSLSSIDFDFVAVAESWDNGFGEDGSIYILAPSSEFEANNGIGSSSYELRLVSRSSWRFSTITKPLFVDSSLYIGGSISTMAGWTGNRDISDILAVGSNDQEDINPRWSFQFRPDPDNEASPFLHTPTMSTDGSRLYVADLAGFFLGLQSQNGRIDWAVPIDGKVASPPLFYNNNDSGDNVIYIIETNGSIKQINSNGEELWTLPCQNGAACVDSVQADFALSPSGNTLYYGDSLGRISAIGVANFVTLAPTFSPSSLPTALPSVSPSISQAPSAALATNAPSTIPTISITSSPTIPEISITSSPENSPTSQPSSSNDSIFLTDNDKELDAVEGSNENDSDSDDDNLGILIGAIVGGLAVVLIVAFFVGKNLLHPSSSKKRKQHTEKTDAVVQRDVEADLDAPYGANVERVDSDNELDISDDVTVVSGSTDSVEIEYGSAKDKAKTPPSKKAGTKLVTPPTATSLSSIQEAEEEEDMTKEDDTKLNLVSKFSAAMDDQSAFSDESSIPPPPPDNTVDSPEESSNVEPSLLVEEEKKDCDSVDDSTLEKTLSPIGTVENRAMDTPSSPVAPTSPSLMDSLNRALAYVGSPITTMEEQTKDFPLSPGVMSTDSSLYTAADDKSSFSATKPLSPLSTGIFGDRPTPSMDESLPEDESLRLLAIDGFQDMNRPDASTNRTLPFAPGAHYLAKGSLRPRFKPSTVESVPKIKSARTNRNLAGFSKSYLNQSEDEVVGEESNSESESERTGEISRIVPSFKRRTKPEKKDDTPSKGNAGEQTVGGTWNNFLNDLAAAEEEFFSPTHAQKSALLRYNKDDDSTAFGMEPETDADDILDDATVKTSNND